jgi:hypothetical protein
VGEMGCSLRTDYTAIGRAANLGARICDRYYQVYVINGSDQYLVVVLVVQFGCLKKHTIALRAI